jgi:hypothetical protein
MQTAVNFMVSPGKMEVVLQADDPGVAGKTEGSRTTSDVEWPSCRGHPGAGFAAVESL